MSNYYHAGAQIDGSNVVWSDATRKTASAAEKEAKQMAKRHGGKPVVECWSRQHGMRPNDANVVVSAYEVE